VQAIRAESQVQLSMTLFLRGTGVSPVIVVSVIRIVFSFGRWCFPLGSGEITRAGRPSHVDERPDCLWLVCSAAPRQIRCMLKAMLGKENGTEKRKLPKG
jgi:hypothetical protein